MNDYRAHISSHKRQALLRCFINETTASQAAESCKVMRKTADRWYRHFRECIYESQKVLRRLEGEIEADHAFFGARGRKRYTKKDGKFIPRVRQKFMVFGFLQRSKDGKHIVSTHHIPKADTDTLMPLVRLVVAPGARIYTDSWQSFNTLEKDGYVHRTVNHRRKTFAKKDGIYSVHTGTLDQYFKFARQHLGRFGRLHLGTLHLHLKETEFRYNHRHDFREALRSVIQQYEMPASYTKKESGESVKQKKKRS